MIQVSRSEKLSISSKKKKFLKILPQLFYRFLELFSKQMVFQLAYTTMNFFVQNVF